MTARPDDIASPLVDETTGREIVGRPVRELRDEGLLWLINRTVFHPRGFALAFQVDEDGDVIGWDVLGDGTESWGYADSIDEDELFRAAEDFFASRRPDVVSLWPPESDPARTR